MRRRKWNPDSTCRQRSIDAVPMPRFPIRLSLIFHIDININVMSFYFFLFQKWGWDLSGSLERQKKKNPNPIHIEKFNCLSERNYLADRNVIDSTAIMLLFRTSGAFYLWQWRSCFLFPSSPPLSQFFFRFFRFVSICLIWLSLVARHYRASGELTLTDGWLEARRFTSSNPKYEFKRPVISFWLDGWNNRDKGSTEGRGGRGNGRREAFDADDAGTRHRHWIHLIICNDKMPTRNQMEGENKKKGKKKKKKIPKRKKKRKKRKCLWRRRRSSSARLTLVDERMLKQSRNGRWGKLPVPNHSTSR